MAEDPNNPLELQPQPPDVKLPIAGSTPASPEAAALASQAAQPENPEQGLGILAGSTPGQTEAPPTAENPPESALTPVDESDRTLIGDYLAQRASLTEEKIRELTQKYNVDPGPGEIDRIAQKLGVGQSEASETPPETVSSETLRTDVSDVRSMPEAEGPARSFVEPTPAEAPAAEPEAAAPAEAETPSPAAAVETEKVSVPPEPTTLPPDATAPAAGEGTGQSPEEIPPMAGAEEGEPVGTDKTKDKSAENPKDQFKDLKDFIAQRDAERDKRWEEEIKKLRDELEKVKSGTKTAKLEKEGFRGRKIEGVKFPSINEWAELSEKERIDFIKKAIRTEAASVTDTEARDIIRHLDRDQTNDPEYSAKVAAAAIYKDSHGGLTNRERNRLMLTNPEVGLLLAERYQSLDTFRKTAEKLGLKGFSFTEWFSETLREHGPKAASAILMLMALIAAGAVGPSVIKGVVGIAR